MPNTFKLDGFRLGQWVSVQRTKEESVYPERKQRLNDIGFVWDPLAAAWEEGFSKLLQFKELEGHCVVPQRFKLDGFTLGHWVNRQRTFKDSLSSEQKQRLDKLGFIWDALDEVWEQGLAKMIEFKEMAGHLKIPQKFEFHGFSLGRWVSRQRAAKDSMSAERKQRLNDIGFALDPHSEAWEGGFSKLLQFKEQQGHCRVPHGFELDGFKLFGWVSNQRTKRDSMQPERKQRLDDIGFIWDASKGKT